MVPNRNRVCCVTLAKFSLTACSASANFRLTHQIPYHELLEKAAAADYAKPALINKSAAVGNLSLRAAKQVAAAGSIKTYNSSNSDSTDF
jgi:hypothetical protein